MAADVAFETVAVENQLVEYEASETTHEAPGTVRLAGDDSYAVQMLEKEVAEA